MTDLASKIFYDLLNSKGRIFSEQFENKYLPNYKNAGAVIRESINEIIESQDEYIIGGSSTGYFIARTEQEADEAIGLIYSREIKLRQRRQKLEKIKLKRFDNANQMSLL